MTARQEPPSPFGRYRIALPERCFHAVFALVVVVLVRFLAFAPHAGDYLPAWYRGLLICATAYLLLAVTLQWLIPATTIGPEGFIRTLAVRRHADWDEVADFAVGRVLGWKRVVMRLQSGRKVPLLGVPLGAVDQLRQYVGTGSAVPRGTWWLVDIRL